MVQKNFTKEIFRKNIDNGAISQGSLLELKVKENYICGYFLDSSKIDIRLASSYPKPQQTIIVNMDDITHYEIYKVK